jgi:hypothetical protein
MDANLPTRSDAARSRLRSIVPTLLLILISVLIVRDIFVRRWGSATPPASDVTQRFR